MSYNQYISADSVLDTIEKNATSVARFIQPEWLRTYYQTVTEANLAVARTMVTEVEKALPTDTK